MIKEIEVDREKIYLKKSAWFGWGVVFPLKNPDGTINWKNLITGGSWWNLGVVAFIVVILVIAMFEVKNIVSIANECLANQNLNFIIQP